MIAHNVVSALCYRRRALARICSRDNSSSSRQKFNDNPHYARLKPDNLSASIFNIALRNAKLLMEFIVQDKNDFLTLDVFSKPLPGRPRTATPDKKRIDAANRARRYRQAKSDKSLILDDLPNQLHSLFCSANYIHGCFDEHGNVLPQFTSDVASYLRLFQEDIIKLGRFIGMPDRQTDSMSYLLDPDAYMGRKS